MGKTNPLNDGDLEEFVELQKSFADSDKSWTVPVTELTEESWDLSVKNPNAEEQIPLREPDVIIEDIIALDEDSELILENIRKLL